MLKLFNRQMWTQLNNELVGIPYNKLLKQEDVPNLEEGTIVLAQFPGEDHPNSYRIRIREYPDRRCIYLTQDTYQEAPCNYTFEIGGANPDNVVGNGPGDIKVWLAPAQSAPPLTPDPAAEDDNVVFKTIRW